MNKYEPLRGKTKILCSEKQLPKYAWYEDEDVKSAVNFYKKYKDNQMLLKREKPKLREKYVKYCSKKTVEDEYRGIVSKVKIDPWITWIYNDWLFNYCFGDVIE